MLDNKLNNPKLKGALGVASKVMLVASAIGAFVEVFTNDAQSKKIEELSKKVAELEKH